MSIPKEFLARLFVYAMASTFLGSAMLLFLQTLQIFLEAGDWRTYVAWVVIAATWSNLTFVLTRRFVGGAFGYKWYPAIIPVLICLPVPLFMALRSEAMLEMVSLLILPVIAASSYLGFRFGVKYGDLRREEKLKSLK